MRRALQTLVVLALTAQSASAGIYYVASNHSVGDTDAKAADWNVRGWIDGESAKIEFLSSGNPLMPQGSYLLTHDGGKTIFLVDEAKGTYSPWDLDAMLGSLGSVMGAAGGVLSMELANLSVEKLEEESAGAMHGFPCVRSRYRTSYDMRMKILGMKRENQVVVEQEIWATDALDDVALGVWLRKEPPSLGDEGFDQLVRSEMAKLQGFPLKTVTVTTTTAQKGRATTQTHTMEVTELREESIAAETFVLDPTLTEQPMPMLGATGEDPEERGGLRGLLKRRDGN